MRVPVHRERLIRVFINLTKRYYPEFNTVLDVGCGGLCEAFNRIYGEDNYTGLDIESCGYPVDVIGNAENIQYEDNSVDVVTGWSVIEHLLNPYNGMCEMLRVSRQGFIVTTDLTERDKNTDPTHLYSWTPKTLTQLFSKLPARETHVFSEAGLLVGVAYK
jgi:hypothetical protein